MGAQMVMGVIHAYARKTRSTTAESTPVSTEAITEHQRIYSMRQAQIHRLSNDSGQGTEPDTESLRSNSLATIDSIDNLPELQLQTEDEEVEEKHGLMHGTAVDTYLTNKIPALIPSRLIKVLEFPYDTIDRLVLILGFIAIASGIVTYGGFFVSSRTYLKWLF